MSTVPLPQSNAELAELLRKQLGVGGKPTLKAKLRRAPGLLPRALRAEVRYLAEMEGYWENPRLRRIIDTDKVAHAQANLRSFLEAVDPRDRMIGRLVGILAPLMFNILLIFAAVVTWMAMTGRV